MKLVSLYFMFLIPLLFGVVSCTLNEADQPVKIFGRITGSDGNGIMCIYSVPRCFQSIIIL